MFKHWGELGLLGVGYPESDGGSGFNKVSYCIVHEEMSRVPRPFLRLGWPTPIWPIWSAGSVEQKGRIFKPTVSGDKLPVLR